MHDDGTMVEDVASLRGSSVAPFVVSLWHWIDQEVVVCITGTSVER